MADGVWSRHQRYAISDQPSAMLGLYIHVPFCSAICNYCNFNRGLFDAALKDRYVDALVAEIAEAGPLAQDGQDPADTIYFGGGTPSLLEPDEVGRIIEACESSFAVAPDPEITLEANPETVTMPKLAAFRQAGVNRLSFGVQSFRDTDLRRLSRLHSADRARLAVAEARAAGFDNISLDLMMWLPQQSVSEWLESVDQAVALGPEHLSLYLLELYPNAPLKDGIDLSAIQARYGVDVWRRYGGELDAFVQLGYLRHEGVRLRLTRPGMLLAHEVMAVFV